MPRKGFVMRGHDLNVRPPGYEPDELPTALPRNVLKKGTALECQPLTMKLIALNAQNPVTISTRGKAKPNKIMNNILPRTIQIYKVVSICQVTSVLRYPLLRTKSSIYFCWLGLDLITAITS